MKPQKHIPPKLPQRLLTWLLRDDLTEEVLGDLEEKFYAVAEKNSLARAKFNYWYQVINYLRPFAVRKTRYYNHTAMFRHNIILTLRSFKKHKRQFFINLTGLSSGIACVLFIYLWINDEFQINRFHQNSDRMYQVMTNHANGNEIMTQLITPGLLLEELQAEVPEVEKATVWLPTPEVSLSEEGIYHKAEGMFASREFFDVFTYPLLKGNPARILSDPSGIVLSESLAKRIFKDKDPVGKSIEWHLDGMSKTLLVTGLMKDVPKNTMMSFDYLVSWDFYHDELHGTKRWTDYYAPLTIVLTEEVVKNEQSLAAAKQKINKVFKENNDDQVNLLLAKYADLHLYDNYENGQQAGGRIEYVRLFMIIGLFILFIASINFINLSTAKAICRTKEIGIKKSFGASRWSLRGQYLTESVLLSLIALAAALLAVRLLLPYFNQIVKKDIALTFDWPITLVALSTVVVIGLIAGSFPAFYLSRLHVLNVLKGSIGNSHRQAWGRQALVVFQFTLSIIMIASVLVVYEQMEYVKHKNIGYDRENLLYFKREGKLASSPQAFVEELQKLPAVSDVALTTFKADTYNWTAAIDWEGKSPEDRVQFHQLWTGVGAIEMLSFDLLRGRAFSKDLMDEGSIILNETAVKVMGLKDPVGKTIRHWTGEKKIIGVVKDFNYKSLHTSVGPTVILYGPDNTQYIMAKLQQGDQLETINRIEELYGEFNPGYPFVPGFLDQDYQKLYASEERIGVLAKYFAAFAIFISCLGLLGLSAFTTERKTKEIGIRKVLGASAAGMVFRLSAHFSKMVLLAAIIALPVSYLVASSWLEGFAYRTNLHWWIFLLAALGAFVLAWITVGLQTFKVVRINPSECLRDE